MVNKTKTIGLALVVVLVVALSLTATAETNESVMVVTPETDETVNISVAKMSSEIVAVDKAEMSKAVTLMLTELEGTNKSDWELIFPDQEAWIFVGGTYDFSWTFSDGYGIPLKTVAVIPKNGSLADLEFLLVRQNTPYDGSCSTTIPPELERGEYMVVVVLDYPGVQGTFFQVRMYCEVLIFDEEPTNDFDPWLMLTSPWLVQEDEKQPMSTQPLPERPKSSGFI